MKGDHLAKPQHYAVSVYNSSIYSGGTYLTIIGQHMDSVYAPEMIVYVDQGNTRITNFTTVSCAQLLI